MKDYNFENGLPVGDKVKTFFFTTVNLWRLKNKMYIVLYLCVRTDLWILP